MVSVSDKIVKPQALRAGAMLGIVAPASAVDAAKLAAGVKALEGMGYRTKVFAHARDCGPLHYAGSVEARVEDLHAAFADDDVDGIVCARGGWGSAELLPHLDKALIAAHPKVFVGYSDITSLLVWLRDEVGLVTFQGPMVTADFARDGGVDAGSWEACMGGAAAWSLGPGDGLRVLRAGVAEGALRGGCLSIYAEAAGTPYAARLRGGILFLEDVGTKAYQWDRMLVHLRYAGMLDGVQGIVFGDMAQCRDAEIEAALLHSLRDFDGPIGIGLRSGHVDGANVTLPFGVKVRLELGGNPRMHFLESAVAG